MLKEVHTHSFTNGIKKQRDIGVNMKLCLSVIEDTICIRLNNMLKYISKHIYLKKKRKFMARW